MNDRRLVLVVDDDDAARTSLGELLRACGYVVACVGNGQEALELLDRVCPDLILLDLDMPVMNGHAFLQVVRSDSELAKIPIVIVSGDKPKRDYPPAVSKPVEPARLLALVVERCERPLPARIHSERRTQNAERRTQNAERRTQNAERRTQNAERRTQNAERSRGDKPHSRSVAVGALGR